MARKAKDTAAPSARPRDRKKAMMAPAVSASCGGTFLYGDNGGTKLIRDQWFNTKKVCVCSARQRLLVRKDSSRPDQQ